MTFLQSFLLWRKFERQQWLSYQELKKIQEKRLRAIVRWAYTTVPYYHRLFRREGLLPDDIRTLGDICKIPIMRKKDVQKNRQEFFSRSVIKGLSTQATTGSTGIPIEIVQDAAHVAAGKAVMLRAFRANGLCFTDRLLRIRHAPYKSSWYERLGIFPTKSASVYDPPDRLASQYNAIKPDAIYAYPSVLQAIAKTNIPLLPVRNVFSTTEALSKGARQDITGAFKARVSDFYGATEFGLIAWECPSCQGHHINMDLGVVECGEDGREGEIIITGFFNHAMPLIRYALGDAASMSDAKCACGRGLPLLKSIEGRMDDWLVMPDGERISPRRVNVLDELKGIEQYRIIQTKRGSVVAEVIPSGAWTESLKDAVIACIRKGMGNHKIIIDAKPVSSIPRGPRGKIRTVVSHVSRV